MRITGPNPPDTEDSRFSGGNLELHMTLEDTRNHEKMYNLSLGPHLEFKEENTKTYNKIH
jgi:hypothetical protein